MPFTQLGLRATILRAVADAGYAVPTPIQQQAIPIVLEGRDLLGGAQTGTGKTAAFVLPILERLLATPAAPGGRRRHVRALILTPTRELAAQVHESVRTYGRHTSIRTTAVFGGVGMRAQVDALVHGIDILVATPGRLLDHVSQRTVDLGRVEVIVLDEADRMLDMGFLPDIKRVLNLLPTERQSLLFSATYTDDIRALAENLLKDPTEVEAPRETIESDLVEQFVYPSMREGKTEILHSLLQRKGCDSALVFTRTRHGADRLARQLARMGVAAAPIHGNLSQTQRTRALRDFKAGHVSVLVATDIAARGLDIDQLPCVVNYDLPWVPEDYVHRIGRTGRAGTAGEAISLVSSDEVQYLQQIERLIGKRLPRCRVEGLEAFTPEGTLESWGAPRVRPLGAPPRSSSPRSGGPRSASDGNRSAGPRPAQAHRPARATLDRRWSAEREARAGSLPPVDHSPNMAAVRAARSRSRGPSDQA